LADFDNDGDLDLVAGNHGLNSGYHASASQPLTIRYGDFNKDDKIDAFLFQYIRGREFPHQTRTQYIEQITTLRKRIYYFRDFGRMQYQDIFSENERATADSLQVFTLATTYFENTGNGRFRSRPLPAMIQLSTVKDMLACDLNHDGNLDLLVVGNLYTPDVLEGRQDACPGWVFKGNGKGSFTPTSLMQSGMFAPGDNRAILGLTFQGQPLIVVAPNQGKVRVFRTRKMSE
jgi:hypothetical protein